MEINKDIELLKQRLSSLDEPYIKAILLFGSKARGEFKDRSDIDLLVLHENCNIEDMVMRRRYFYNILREAIGKEYEDITLVDMELKYFLKPYEINSLLLNIYYDSIAIYDKTGTIESFLKYVKNKIEESGLKRIKNGKAYYWILPKPLKEVKIL